MKRNYTLYILPAIAISIVIMAFNVLYPDGSPGAKTGSPGDGGASCVQCHVGTPQNVENWITSDIPGSGYKPDSTYIITATATHAGASLFGFELTAEGSMDEKIGTFGIIDDGTMLVNNNGAVTHTHSGTTPSNGSKSWTMEWTAPAQGSFGTTFYAAFNAANGDNTSGGDVIYLSSLYVQEETDPNGLIDAYSGHTVYPYPNPVISDMYIDMIPDVSGVIKISIFDMGGRLMLSEIANGSSGKLEVDLSGIPSGQYFVKIISGNQDFTGRIVKK